MTRRTMWLALAAAAPILGCASQQQLRTRLLPERVKLSVTAEQSDRTGMQGEPVLTGHVARD